MSLRSFYTCYSSGASVDSQEPIEIESEGVFSLARQILLEPLDFFGLIDDDNRTLQFYFEESGDIWMEIPCPEKRGSFGRRLDFVEMEAVLAGLPGSFTPETVGGLAFSRW